MSEQDLITIVAALLYPHTQNREGFYDAPHAAKMAMYLCNTVNDAYRQKQFENAPEQVSFVAAAMPKVRE